jgi:hypothetical protein
MMCVALSLETCKRKAVDVLLKLLLRLAEFESALCLLL